ncbi:MAG TPA: hypothetical protein VH143_06160 [Kofleriaceae bacterium]|nr:hypothetical protein [Kofleriaceae bacterium]
MKVMLLFAFVLSLISAASVTRPAQADNCNWSAPGCNSYGCWQAGGGCNSYGCWTDGGGCNSYGCWDTPDGSCNQYGCDAHGTCSSYGCP